MWNRILTDNAGVNKAKDDEFVDNINNISNWVENSKQSKARTRQSTTIKWIGQTWVFLYGISKVFKQMSF